jgi:hypothetical protein
MNVEIKRLLSGFVLREGAPQSAIDAMVAELGVSLPEEYLDLLRFTNGGEGCLGSDDASNIQFWSVEDIVTFNREYGIWEDHPQLVVFGKNAAAGAFGFDTSQSPMPVIEADFIDNEYCEERGQDFLDFLRRMAAL